MSEPCQAALTEAAAWVVRTLLERGATVATAESCTGGGTAAALTGVPGASGAFECGVVAYANRIKEQLLGVPAEVLERWGAVSEPTARAMAQGVRALAGSVYGVSTTGIAGPGGGTAQKPVGTVYIAACGPEGCLCERLSLGELGSRDAIRAEAVRRALLLLRRLLRGDAADGAGKTAPHGREP